MNTVIKFKTFGKPLPLPLATNGDWVRIQCGVDGEPNFIFGTDGLKEFYEAGAGIYTRDNNGRPKDSFQDWLDWYEKQKTERVSVSETIDKIKDVVKNKLKL